MRAARNKHVQISRYTSIWWDWKPLTMLAGMAADEKYMRHNYTIELVTMYEMYMYDVRTTTIICDSNKIVYTNRNNYYI